MHKLAEKSLKVVTMVTKIFTCNISVTVPDRPIVTIIHRAEFIHFTPLTCGDLVDHKRSRNVNFA